jgi:phytoene dehydrogenase-like protein
MSTSAIKNNYDVVILGAGHNGLVAASYLGRAGLSFLLLEKNDYVGGATTSQKVFPDYDARLSRYSYLVSLFPDRIIRERGQNAANAQLQIYKQRTLALVTGA